MTTTPVGAPSASMESWEAIDWRRVASEVERLQMRIAKAVREKRWGKVKALQWLLTHSFFAKLWAVRRVVSNRGKRTPGVDGVVWKTPRQKLAAARSIRRKGYRPLPLRRIYIPKKNSGKKRPLSIPTMGDRAQQALYLLALNPVAETLADPNSYGFRLRRSIADALEQCFIVLSRKSSAQWILEGDIEACFDRFSHPWLLAHIPTDTSILKRWLGAGYIEDATFHPTHEGTPQGGIISPVIANLALDGLERVAKEAAPPRSKVNVIRYADDFIITACSKELLEEKIRPAVTSFLAERGLRLSATKTKISRIEDGFDFLGANVRKYKGKLLIKPSKDNFRSFMRKLSEFARSHRAIPTVEMIRALNQKILGWTSQNRHLVASRTFAKLDYLLFRTLWQWAKRRHNNKGSKWVKAKYFRAQGNRNWIFSAPLPNKDPQRLLPGSPKVFLDLVSASKVPIRRHIKVRGHANPFDPGQADYFRRRRKRQLRNRSRGPSPLPTDGKS
jgi:RNA-directed DNA polymerase